MRSLSHPEPETSEVLARGSHDLRTPLTLIIGYLEILLEPRAAELPPERREELIQLINSNSERLLKAVDDLLSLQRP